MWLKHRTKTEELNISAVPCVFSVIWAVDLSLRPLAHWDRQTNGNVARLYYISWVIDAKTAFSSLFCHSRELPNELVSLAKLWVGPWCGS